MNLKDTLDILDTLDTPDKTISDEYLQLIDNKFKSFQKKNQHCCMALTHSNLQCKYSTYINKPGMYLKTNILCKLHRKKKYNPEYIIVFIDNNNNDEHIIAYPYKNKEKYYKDIEIYKEELKYIYIDNYKKIKEIVTCKVCNDTFTHNDLIKCNNITCDNKHIVCSPCLSGYIDSQIINNIGTYDCMFNTTDKCNGNYTITSIEKVIKTESDSHDNNDNTKLSKWQELVNITDVFKLANICDNYFICPLCRKWGCIIEHPPVRDRGNGNGNDREDNIYIDCNNCKLKWCNICKREEHGDYSCYKLHFTDKESDDYRLNIIDIMIQDIISNVLTHKCSTCGCAYIKEEGCNLMCCSHCGGMTCYLCNTKIYYKEGRGKYWHFIGHELSDSDAICSIWNTNTDIDIDIDNPNLEADDNHKQANIDYNNKKIIKELLLFICSNFNYKNIQEIICDRIKFLYEKDEELKFIPKIINKINLESLVEKYNIIL